MAYISSQKIQDEEDPNAIPTLGASGGIIGTGEGGGGVMPAGAQPSGKSNESGQFANLQQYLEKNQTQAGNLAGLVAGQVGTVGEAGKTAAESLAQTGQQAIEAARVPLNQELVDAAAKTPETVDQDAAQKAEFTKERDATYTGPNSLEDLPDYSTAQSAVKKAVDTSTLSSTDAGRKQLLTDLRGPAYGPGKATLDNLLLEGNPEAAGQIATAAQPYANLMDYLTAQDTAAQAAAVQAANEAAATKAAIADRFMGTEGVIPGFQADLSSRLAAAQGVAGSQYTTIQEKLVQGLPLTQTEMALIGAKNSDIKSIRAAILALNETYNAGAPGVDSYLGQTGTSGLITQSNLATPEDYARSAALADLMASDTPILNPADVGQAGTAPTSMVNYDLTGAKAGSVTALTEKDQATLAGAKVTGDVSQGVIAIPNASTIPGVDKDTLINELKSILARGGAGKTGGVKTSEIIAVQTGLGGAITLYTPDALAKAAASAGLTVDQFLNMTKLAK